MTCNILYIHTKNIFLSVISFFVVEILFVIFVLIFPRFPGKINKKYWICILEGWMDPDPYGKIQIQIQKWISILGKNYFGEKKTYLQGWAIALFGKERIALFFAKKSKKKSERGIRSFCALSFFLKRAKERFALFKRAKEQIALLEKS